MDAGYHKITLNYNVMVYKHHTKDKHKRNAIFQPRVTQTSSCHVTWTLSCPSAPIQYSLDAIFLMFARFPALGRLSFGVFGAVACIQEETSDLGDHRPIWDWLGHPIDGTLHTKKKVIVNLNLINKNYHDHNLWSILTK